MEDKYLVSIEAKIRENSPDRYFKVNNLTSIKTILFEKDQYEAILNLIKEGEIRKVINWTSSNNKGDQYLDILTFVDQELNKYVVTVYDSIDLWQDPEIIDIVMIP